MAIEVTLPSESTQLPDALPTAADDHRALTGNASFRLAGGGVIDGSDTPLPAQVSNATIDWVPPSPEPLPPRRKFVFDAGPVEPPFPPSSNNLNLNDVKQSSFDTLMARVALLEATVAARPAGVGHNQGPDLDDNLSIDEAGIQNLIALLKVENATTPVGLARLTEAARIADPSINKGQERVDQYVKGVLMGAGIQTGKEIVAQLSHAAWVHSVYSALQAVFVALTSWINLFF